MKVVACRVCGVEHECTRMSNRERAALGAAGRIAKRRKQQTRGVSETDGGSKPVLASSTLVPAPGKMPCVRHPFKPDLSCEYCRL